MSHHYDYLIIGAGLFGSAAARYLSLNSDSVALVGPAEPSNYATHDGVYASHYDEARIVSQSAPDEIWQQLDQASIAQYTQIEAQSGISFFSPSGRISAVQQGSETNYPYRPSDAQNCQPLLHEDATAKYRLSFPPSYQLTFEEVPSGYLNPLAMVRAQTAIAQQQGAERIIETVVSIENQASHVEVRLSTGKALTALRVLIAAGAFTNCFDLVKEKLALQVESNPTLLAQVASEDAETLREMPPINYRIESNPEIHLSILPPLPYADGHHYVKVVITSHEDEILPDFGAISAWFQGQASTESMPLVKETVQSLLPQTPIVSWRTKPCVATYTPSRKPMIDALVPGRIYLATGGNGGSAHPSDAIGQLAADLMMNDRWLSPLPHDPFRICLARDWDDWMQTPSLLWQG